MKKTLAVKVNRALAGNGFFTMTEKIAQTEEIRMYVTRYVNPESSAPYIPATVDSVNMTLEQAHISTINSKDGKMVDYALADFAGENLVKII